MLCRKHFCDQYFKGLSYATDGFGIWRHKQTWSLLPALVRVGVGQNHPCGVTRSVMAEVAEVAGVTADPVGVEGWGGGVKWWGMRDQRGDCA